MAIVSLLGHGIGYSASPTMHSAAFAALGLEHRYVLADVAPAALHATVSQLRDRQSLGANVTAPHKTAVLHLLDEVERTAREASAVNTVVNHGGRLVGHNTDIPALVDEIGALHPSPRRTVVLGAGGAARGVAAALDLVGCPATTFVSRSGRATSRDTAEWAALPTLLADAELLINATPVGTASDETPVPAEWLHPDLAVLDLVYRPSPTRLVREARARGLSARAGAGVLLGQGWRSLELWLDVTAPRAEMAAALRSELGDAIDV